MIRSLSLIASGAFILAVAFLLIDGDGLAIPAIVLILIAIPIGAFLAVRRGYLKAREIAGMAQAFVTGNVQHARIVDVGDPKGIFFPKSELVLELEGGDGAIHRFDREVPVPALMAWSYRLGKRFKAPWIGNTDLSSMMAFELKREGLDVDLNWRPDPGREIIDGPVTSL